MTETKKRKKPLLMVLLVLCVVLAMMLVGTLAKFMTSGTLSDGASVAKFGLNIPTTINLFADSYTNVQADADGKKIIAPGTSGQYTFTVTGTSEVAYQVSANVSLDYSDAWGAHQPLKFSINGTDFTDFAQFQIDLATALGTQSMAPNQAYASTQTIYWRWPFFASTQDDTKDTALGQEAATGTAATVEMTIQVIATQID